MKQKRFNKKLVVNKVTISNLTNEAQSVIRGGGTVQGRTCDRTGDPGTIQGRTCDNDTNTLLETCQ